MSNQAIIAAHGFKILPRAEFFNATTNLIAPCGVDHDGELFEALKKRASQFEGAFVLYDPSDDDGGWMLIGDDADKLAKETVMELDLR